MFHLIRKFNPLHYWDILTTCSKIGVYIGGVSITMAERLQDSEFVEDELKGLKAKITDLRSVELIACHIALIQARIK